MKAAELRQKSPAELQQALIDLQRQLFNLNIQHGSGQLTATNQIRQVRRDIARVKTIMTEASNAATGAEV